MKSTYLKVFYIVAKHQNISKAAKELNVTQPAISRIITSIEEEYETKLFIRSKSGVSLTREGLHLFEIIKNPLEELRKVESALESIGTLSDNVVHIGATATALSCYLFAKLEIIKKRFPKASFKIYTNSSKNLTSMVSKGIIDFAFITTPFIKNDELEVYDVYQFNNILIAPISYKDKIKGKVSIADLEKFPFILLNREMQFREHVEEYLLKNGVKIIPSYETDSSSVLIPFVENDCGLTFVPEETAKESIKEGKCFKVDLIEEMDPRCISFIIKKDRSQASLVYDVKETFLKD